MNYFPDKPWNVGDEFENETTGVVYRYDGTKWVAIDDDINTDAFVSKSGDVMTGRLQLKETSDILPRDYVTDKDLLGTYLNLNLGGIVKGNFISADSGGTTGIGTKFLDLKEGMEIYTDENVEDEFRSVYVGKVMRDGIQWSGNLEMEDDGKITNLPDPVNDGDPVTLGFLKSYESGVGEEQGSSSFRKLRFARDKDWNNLRPGEFGLMDDSNNFVGQWSKAYSIFFSAIDVDGNRLVQDQNDKDYVSDLGSAMSIFTSSGERPILRVAPTLSLTGLVQLEYVKDLDLFWIGWIDNQCSALQTSTNDNLSNGQTFLINIPDLFL